MKGIVVMKKEKTTRCRLNIFSFAVGALFCALVISLIIPVKAALTQKTIDVYTGITIYVDDQMIEPKDANGNTVDPFIYNGTTYLPVRALSNALGKPIVWEGNTRSVYVGKHNSATPSVMLKDLDYLTGSERIETAVSEMDNYGNTHFNVITKDFQRTYIINDNYSSISGTIFQTYDARSETVYADQAKLEIYGDGQLLFVYSLPQDKKSVTPQDFSVDLSGVIELRVVFSAGDYYNVWWGNGGVWPLSLGDCGLYT